MGIMTTALVTSISGATTLVPSPSIDIEEPAQFVALPSDSMPSVSVFITQTTYSEIAEHIWHDIAWDALAASTEELYAL